MKRWADSKPPTAVEIADAVAAGFGGIAGYFEGPGVDPGHWWSDADFGAVRAAGLDTLAYCSGWADPAAMRARAARLGIKLALDDEGGIRPHGAWVQPWLDAAGAGQYANGPFMRGIRAAFFIAAGYPGFDPAATWPSAQQWQAFGWGQPIPKPDVAGWQWQGTHAQLSASIDSSWFDDALDGLHGPGSGTQGEDELLFYKEAEHGYLFIVGDAGRRYVWGFEGADWEAKLGAPVTKTAAELAAIPVVPQSTPAGGTEPPEPSEPTTVTLTVPAQTITGKLS